PLLLNKTLYEGKTIIISNGEEIKQIKLTNKQIIDEISFLNESHFTPNEVDVNPIPNEEIEGKNEDRTEVLKNQIEELERKKIERKKLEEEGEKNILRKEREELEKLKEKRERIAELNR